MKSVKKTVLFFDICSSSAIIEDLHRNEKEASWRQVILNISRYLNNYHDKELFEIYKFQGDGWILFFDDEFNPDKVFSFLVELCYYWEENYEKHIEGMLDKSIYPTGITFGMDNGSLFQLQLNGKTEYLGRSLNVAARLQSSIKDIDGEPQFKLLMPNHVYATIGDIIQKNFEVENVDILLRNISEEELKFKKVVLLPVN